MVYSPADFVVAIRTSPVSIEVAVTVAPTTTAPVLSVTVPLIPPVSAWPKAQTENRVKIASRESNFNVFRFIALSAPKLFRKGEYGDSPRIPFMHESGHGIHIDYKQVT